jgi:hypothetical protein
MKGHVAVSAVGKRILAVKSLLPHHRTPHHMGPTRVESVIGDRELHELGLDNSAEDAAKGLVDMRWVEADARNELQCDGQRFDCQSMSSYTVPLTRCRVLLYLMDSTSRATV